MLALLGGLFAAPLLGQLPPPEAAPPDAVHDDMVTVSWVTLPLHAGLRGVPVLQQLQAQPELGLPVEIDDRLVEVDLLAGGQDPIELEVLLDQSGSMAYEGRLERARATLGCAIGALDARDRAVVYGLHTRSGRRQGQRSLLDQRLVLPDAAEEASVAQLLDQLPWPTRGDTSLIDGLLELATHASRSLGSAPRRWTVVITDGGDNASRRPLRELRAALTSLDQPVLVVDVARRDRTASSRPIERADLVLAEIASITGGAVLDAPDRQDREDEDCRRLQSLVRSQLLFGFPADPTTEVRAHKVRVLSADGKPLRRLGLVHPASYRGHAPLDGR